MIVTSEPNRLKIDANSAPMIPPPRMTSRRGTSVWASNPVESTQRSLSRPGIGGRSGNEPVATIALLNVTSSPPSTRIVFGPVNVPEPLTHSTPLALKSAGDAAGHLLDDCGLPLVRLREVELRLTDRHAELAERVVRLVHEMRGLHPRLGRDAPDPQAGSAELGLLLDARDLGAELRGANRCGVPAGASAEDCDVDIHAGDRSDRKDHPEEGGESSAGRMGSPSTRGGMKWLVILFSSLLRRLRLSARGPKRGPHHVVKAQTTILPNLLPAREPLVGVLRPGERERLLDRDAESAPGHERREGLDHQGLLGDRSCPQHRAVDASALPHQQPEIELGARAGAGPDHRDAPPSREPREVRREVGAADQLEDHVVLAVDVGIGAERAQLVVMVARVRGHTGTSSEPELHRGAPDAARGTVHEQPLPGSELRLREERVVRRREHLDEAARLLPAHPVRHGEHVRLMRDRQLRLAAAGKERHHAPSVRGLAGAFQPRHVGRAGRRRIAAGALPEIGPVHARGADTDEDLAVLRYWVGPLLDLDPAVDDRRCAQTNRGASASRPRRPARGRA